MHALVIRTKSNQYQHQKMQEKTNDEHKHCIMQPFDTVVGGIWGPQEADY